MNIDERFVLTETKKIKPNGLAVLMVIACQDHLPMEEKMNREAIQKAAGIGRDAARKAINTLIKVNLITRTQSNVKGQFKKYHFSLSGYAKIYLKNFLGASNCDIVNSEIPQPCFQAQPETENPFADSNTAAVFSGADTPETENPFAVKPENPFAVSLYNKLVVVDNIITTTIKGTENPSPVAVTKVICDDAFVTEQLLRIHKIEKNEIEDLAEIFILKNKERKLWSTYNEFRKHFLNWIPYYAKSKEYENRVKQQSAPQDISLLEKVGAYLSV